MKIPFCFTFAGPLPRAIAWRLIESIVRHMPQSHIYHQTDMDTEAFHGTQTVRLERGADFAEFFLRHLKLCELPRFVKIDYDCVVQRDLAPLFVDAKWQVGLTKRDDTDPTLSPEISRRQPYNNGVIFSNGRHTFFNEVYDEYMGMKQRDGWMDAQEAVKAVVAKTKVPYQEFPCSVYNYTPAMPDEDLKSRAIVHYKGTRKHWALDTSDMAAAMDEGIRVGEMAQSWIKGKMYTPALAKAGALSRP